MASRLAIFAASVLPLAAGQPLTQRERQQAVDELQASRKLFLDAIGGLSPAQWTFKPAPDRWSVAECAEHVALAEDSYFELVSRLAKSQATPDKKSDVKDEDVVRTMADRGSKRLAVESLQPSGRWSQEALIKRFNRSRDRLVAYVHSTPDGLRSRFRTHRAMGLIDGYQWILLASGHVRRHTAQIEEVKAHSGFPK